MNLRLTTRPPPSDVRPDEHHRQPAQQDLLWNDQQEDSEREREQAEDELPHTDLTHSSAAGSSESPQIPEGDLSWSDIVESQMRSGYINLFDSIGDSSAEVAFRTYQKPIRVVIHASHLLAKDGAS